MRRDPGEPCPAGRAGRGGLSVTGQARGGIRKADGRALCMEAGPVGNGSAGDGRRPGQIRLFCGRGAGQAGGPENRELQSLPAWALAAPGAGENPFAHHGQSYGLL